MFLCSPPEGGKLRPGISNFNLVEGEFDKVDVNFWRGLTCEVLKNKDFDAVGKPTIVFYHG
jgi:hypothetical protein